MSNELQYLLAMVVYMAAVIVIGLLFAKRANKTRANFSWVVVA